MVKLWADTYALLRGNLSVLVMLVLMPAGMEALGLELNAGLEIALIWITAYWLFRSFLLGETLGQKPAPGAPAAATWRFFGLSFLWIGLIAAGTLGLTLAVDLGLGLNLGSDERLPLIGAMLGLSALLVLLVLGPTLPACATRGLHGPGLRGQQHLRNAGRILGGLLIGPVLLVVFIGLLVSLLPPVFTAAGNPVVAALLPRMLALIVLAMVVALLARVYRDGESRRHLAFA